MDTDILFITTASVKNLPAVRLMIDSLRAFGGELAEAPFWIFAPDPELVGATGDKQLRLLPLAIPESVAAYPFGEKVATCARAEELAPTGTRSLVWIDPSCIVVQPPVLLDLGERSDAAFRPVHIRNVGLPRSEPLDAFWKGIYNAVGVEDIQSTVPSFVDGQILRAYFNSHAFSINPALGLMQRWDELFRQLVGDAQFQSTACADERHQVFLFQALLSTLVASSVEPGRIRVLPSTYNYPNHLQDQIPASLRFAALNEAVCFAYEDLSIRPDSLTGIDVREPLRAWLETRVADPPNQRRGLS
jgi:hypothetical protein